MSAARKNSLTWLVENSVTNKVRELTDVPVEIVAGDAVSNFERYGIPAGVGAALALLYAATEYRVLSQFRGTRSMENSSVARSPSA